MTRSEASCEPANGGSRPRPIVSAALVVLAAAAVVGLWVALVPAPLSAPHDPDYVDNVFDSRVVVWTGRLVLVSIAVVLSVGGAFIVASVVAHMRHGAWLRRAGPFEVSAVALADLEHQIDTWRRAALDHQRNLERARMELMKSQIVINDLSAALAKG